MRSLLMGLAVVAAMLGVLGVAIITPHPAAADNTCYPGAGDKWCATAIAEEEAEQDFYERQQQERDELLSDMEEDYSGETALEMSGMRGRLLTLPLRKPSQRYGDCQLHTSLKMARREGEH